MNVGDLISDAQARKGLNNIDLAKKMGLAPQQISRWRKQDDLRLKTVLSICKALEMDLQDFLQQKSPLES